MKIETSSSLLLATINRHKTSWELNWRTGSSYLKCFIESFIIFETNYRLAGREQVQLRSWLTKLSNWFTARTTTATATVVVTMKRNLVGFRWFEGNKPRCRNDQFSADTSQTIFYYLLLLIKVPTLRERGIISVRCKKIADHWDNKSKLEIFGMWF